MAYQQGELEAALRHVTEGIAGCRQLAYTQPLVTGLAALAWIRHAQGDPAAALNAIEEAERFAPGADVIGLLNPVPAQPAAAAGLGRRQRRCPVGTRPRPERTRRAALPPGAGLSRTGSRAHRTAPAPGGTRAAGAAAHRGGRAGPDRQRNRDPGTASAGTGGQRRRGHGCALASSDADPRLSAGLRAGIGRRGAADARTAWLADRNPEATACRRGPPARRVCRSGWPGPGTTTCGHSPRRWQTGRRWELLVLIGRWAGMSRSRPGTRWHCARTSPRMSGAFVRAAALRCRSGIRRCRRA
jgi:MalT-like TPR region